MEFIYKRGHGMKPTIKWADHGLPLSNVVVLIHYGDYLGKFGKHERENYEDTHPWQSSW
jgi:hypothetical protein